MKQPFWDVKDTTCTLMPRRGITITDVDEATPPWEPIDISPEWFGIGYLTDVYVRLWITPVEGDFFNNFYRQRIMNEWKSFLSAMIAQLKADIDLASTMQTKVIGGMATVGFAVVSRVMHYLLDDE